MMKILAHRGFWERPEQKNTMEAFVKAISMGYGIETDLRDRSGELVISHDPPIDHKPYLEELFALYESTNFSSTLALNIKSDGLQSRLSELLIRFKPENYFLFDMSVPDAIQYLDLSIPCFTRQSEYELVPAFYDRCVGVWLDQFNDDWMKEDQVFDHVGNGKQICLVSPELHGRSHCVVWEWYRNLARKLPDADLMICTDFPAVADKYFNAGSDC